MNTKELAAVLDTSYITIPSSILQNKDKLGISSDEIIVISYFLNNKNTAFNVKELSERLGTDAKQMMKLVSNLQELGLLKIKLIDNSEVVDISDFYDQWAGILTTCKITVGPSIFEQFEVEFGRTLSPIEYEIINNWLEQKVSEELIELALKEAVFNGVNSLRYIDKIIHEWQKKGINTKKAAKQNMKKHYAMKDEKLDSEMFDYNWLEEK